MKETTDDITDRQKRTQDTRRKVKGRKKGISHHDIDNRTLQNKTSPFIFDIMQSHLIYEKLFTTVLLDAG